MVLIDTGFCVFLVSLTNCLCSDFEKRKEGATVECNCWFCANFEVRVIVFVIFQMQEGGLHVWAC